jgi:hypothetical protein
MASASAKTNRQIRISFFNQQIDLQILIISLDGIPNFALAFGTISIFRLYSQMNLQFINPTSDFISVVLPAQF